MNEMMSSLEQAALRSQQKVRPSNLEPAVVRTVADLQRLLVEFVPHAASETVVLSTVMENLDEQHRTVKYAVSAPTRSKSKREILLEGFEVIKKHIELAKLQNSQSAENGVLVNGILMEPP